MRMKHTQNPADPQDYSAGQVGQASPWGEGSSRGAAQRRRKRDALSGGTNMDETQLRQFPKARRAKDKRTQLREEPVEPVEVQSADDGFTGVKWAAFLGGCMAANSEPHAFVTCTICRRQFAFFCQDPFWLWHHIVSVQDSPGHPSAFTVRRWCADRDASRNTTSTSSSSTLSPWRLEQEENRMAAGEDLAKRFRKAKGRPKKRPGRSYADID